MRAVSQSTDRPLDVIPPALILQRAAYGGGDEGAALTSAHAPIQILHDVVIEAYVQTHGHTLAHWPSTDAGSAALWHVDVSVRDLRNDTAKVIAAVEAGTPVTLTVHGRPVADIVPRGARQERRPSAVVDGELEQLADLARALGAQGDARLSDYESGLTSYDF